MNKLLLSCIFPLLICSGINVATAQDAKPAEKDFPGIWEGVLKVSGIELPLVFKVEHTGDKFKSTMDSPAQGAKDIPVETTTVESGKITLKLPKLKITYTGELSADGSSMKGKFIQAGTELPLELKRTDKATELNRPQTPKKPFPYREEEVLVENKQAKDVKLAGTLTLPNGKGPFRAAIMITGSGAQDRDETILGHKPFAVIADYLTRQGIAVLRCDDRGVGKSTGQIATATSADFATDIEAGFDYLKTRPEIDPKWIGLIGHSEGGLIAPMVAADHSDLGFVVMLAGPGVSGAEILMVQSDLISQAMGTSETDRVWSKGLNEKIYTAIKNQMSAEDLSKLFDEGMKTIPEEQRKKITDDELKALKNSIPQITSPWFRYFITYDPRATLAKVTCPVLALNGELDLQVSPKQNLPEIEKALKSGGNKDITIREFPKLNHLFQKAETGAPSEYGKIEETISPEVLTTISDWIMKR